MLEEKLPVHNIEFERLISDENNSQVRLNLHYSLIATLIALEQKKFGKLDSTHQPLFKSLSWTVHLSCVSLRW